MIENENKAACCELDITEVTLLPVEKATSVKKCAGKGAENIWYCLADANTVALVNAGGKTFEWPEGCEYLWSGVRPVLKFADVNGAGLAIGDQFHIAGHTFTIVSAGMALCDELIFHKTLTLTEVKAATLSADSPEVSEEEKEKFDQYRNNPQDNPCTIEGIKNILAQWIEKNNIKVSASDRRNTVELVNEKAE